MPNALCPRPRREFRLGAHREHLTIHAPPEEQAGARELVGGGHDDDAFPALLLGQRSDGARLPSSGVGVRPRAVDLVRQGVAASPIAGGPLGRCSVRDNEVRRQPLGHKALRDWESLAAASSKQHHSVYGFGRIRRRPDEQSGGGEREQQDKDSTKSHGTSGAPPSRRPGGRSQRVFTRKSATSVR